MLKECAAELVPFLCHLFNHILPAIFKSSYICSHIKISSLDAADVNNYWPISNLRVTSKLLEKLDAHQLTKYNSLLPDFQFACYARHLTETATAQVLSYLLTAVDSGDTAALTLLDLSAAFDIVDHIILLQRLECSYGLWDTSLDWFHSYLTDRHQQVVHHDMESDVALIQFGVSQGSVLGPLLFLLYITDVIKQTIHKSMVAVGWITQQYSASESATV